MKAEKPSLTTQHPFHLHHPFSLVSPTHESSLHSSIFLDRQGWWWRLWQKKRVLDFLTKGCLCVVCILLMMSVRSTVRKEWDSCLLQHPLQERNIRIDHVYNNKLLKILLQEKYSRTTSLVVTSWCFGMNDNCHQQYLQPPQPLLPPQLLLWSLSCSSFFWYIFHAQSNLSPVLFIHIM